MHIVWDAIDDQASGVFQALADPTRRRILEELNDRDGQTLFEICARLATKHGVASSRQAISQHLDLLEGADLIKTEHRGRYKFHHLNRKPLTRVANAWLGRIVEERA